MPGKLTQPVIEKWVELSTGTFNVRGIWAELGITTPENKQHLRVILNRLEQAGLVVKTRGDGSYRKVDIRLDPIDWQAADPAKFLPVELPFNIHYHARVYPKSIIICAGEKNQGKTAFLIQSLVLNMDKFVIDFFNSETGPEQLKERLTPFDIPEIPPFNVYERYDNFADVINPEHMTIIDYLDFNSEVYLVGAEIDAIFRKLTTGVAIIGLQKPPPAVTYVKGVRKEYSRDLAYGGAFSAKRASLYVSLGSNKAKLIYVKTPATKGVNPNNKQWSYKFDDNGYFTDIKDYYETQPEY